MPRIVAVVALLSLAPAIAWARAAVPKDHNFGCDLSAEGIKRVSDASKADLKAKPWSPAGITDLGRYKDRFQLIRRWACCAGREAGTGS